MGRNGVPRRFTEKNVPLAAQCMAFLEKEHPMTLRQLFYLMVSALFLEDTSRKHYDRLGRVMKHLREDEKVDMDWIVDNVRRTYKPASWDGLANFDDAVLESYRKDLWLSQDCHVEIFIEKDARASTIEPVTSKYDVHLRVVRGYTSVSYANTVAKLWRSVGKPIHAYYLGDHDPSGYDLERDLVDKLQRYSRRDDFTWQRLGIVEKDFEEFNLLELPPKKTDTRYRNFVAKYGKRCAEVDALTPTELRARVERAIVEHIDPARWERLQSEERKEQEALARLVRRWGKPKI
jgi:hypothetical protein